MIDSIMNFLKCPASVIGTLTLLFQLWAIGLVIENEAYLALIPLLIFLIAFISIWAWTLKQCKNTSE